MISSVTGLVFGGVLYANTAVASAALCLIDDTCYAMCYSSCSSHCRASATDDLWYFGCISGCAKGCKSGCYPTIETGDGRV